VKSRQIHSRLGHQCRQSCARRIEAAVQKVLAQGLRAPDIWSEGRTKVGTAQIGDAVVKALG
jgi:3-isopropylmalate dehydrogenase